MTHSPTRRALLTAAFTLPIMRSSRVCGAPYAPAAVSVHDRLATLEAEANGRLGVAAIRSADGREIGYRADERFPFCSTFKVIAVSALLKRIAAEPGLLQRRVLYTAQDLVTHSPVTQKHVGEGMTVAALCAAALRYSDNTAANLILKLLGGPPAVTAFARSIGDSAFRLNRRELALNTAIPGDPRDTTTPAAMARTLRRLTQGNALGSAERDRLVEWMRGNTTGAKRIRAGVPPGWLVADKTGTGDYGTTNDVGIVWATGKPPEDRIVLALYFAQHGAKAPARDDVLAKATRIVVQTLETR